MKNPSLTVRCLVGIRYGLGQGVRQDYQQASVFFEKACGLNNSTGCAYLGMLYADGQGVRQSYSKSKEYFGKACDLGVQQGCDRYAELNKKGY